MIDPVDNRFFQALHAICAQDETLAPACRAAVEKAANSLDPLEMRAARQAIDGLEAALKDRILQQVHLRMASDLPAIWDALSGAAKTDRMQ